MYILGISAFFHDSAACLIKDEKIIAAAQEERFTRKKHDESFPKNAILYVLSEAGITLDEVDHIGFFEKPFIKFERLIETYLAEAPRGFKSFVTAIPLWLKHKLFLKDTLIRELVEIQTSFEKGGGARSATEDLADANSNSSPKNPPSNRLRDQPPPFSKEVKTYFFTDLVFASTKTGEVKIAGISRSRTTAET